MLKATYTESGLHLEHLNESLEEWITLRVVLALRTGQRLLLETNTASILLPADLVNSSALETFARYDDAIVSLCLCDAEHVEICIQGTWVTSSSDEAEGVFVAVLNPRIEQLLYQLWHAAQNQTSPLWR